MSEYTAEVDGVGTLRLLNAMRSAGLESSCRFYQASTSELYGKVGRLCKDAISELHHLESCNMKTSEL
eukprot:scaffold251_cov230-Pinguiococcus_pyrenoidosus.AAC.3